MASEDNARINDCDPNKIAFSSQFPLPKDGNISSLPSSMTMIIANILANPLIMLAPILMNALQPGGRVALSGILETQADEVLGTQTLYETEAQII